MENTFRPDHKICFVDCEEKDKAYYFCGLLTAIIVKEFQESHPIAIQLSNLLRHMKLPPIEKSNQSHRKLALITEKAYAEFDKLKRY